MGAGFRVFICALARFVPAIVAPAAWYVKAAGKELVLAEYDIAALKAAQDAREAEHAPLREAFNQVVLEFREGLDRYIKSAIAIGMRGVAPIKNQTSHNQHTIFEVTINTIPLVIVVSPDVMPFEFGDAPAARLFVYWKNLDNRPFLDAIVVGSDERFQWQLRVWNRTEDAPSKARVFAIGPATRAGGSEMAAKFINYINSFQWFWNERPELPTLLEPGIATGSIGFRPS